MARVAWLGKRGAKRMPFHDLLNGPPASVLALKQHGLVLLGAGIAILALAMECFQYLKLGAYLDHIEGGIVVSGWEYVINGIPLYQLQDGAPRFATFYGPLIYLVEVPLTFLFGAGIAATKLAPMLAVGATVVLMGRHFFGRGGAAPALYGLFYLISGLLLFTPMSFWVRPDPFETLLVAVAVVMAAHPLAIGICIGLATNFKIHALVFFLPMLIELLASRRWRALLAIAAASCITFLLPFLAPGISLHDYATGLAQQIDGRRPSPFIIVPILIPAMLLSLPLVCPLFTQRQSAQDRIFALSALAALAFLFYPATIPGAGAYHFLPLVPVLAEARSRLQPRGLIAGLTTLPLFLAGLIVIHSCAQAVAVRRGWNMVASDALALARQSPTQSVQIGYGDGAESYNISELSRVILTLNAYPALVDAQVLMELHQVGVDGSKRWLPYLTQCVTERWLLPKGETPFGLKNFLYHGRPTFDAEFQRAFLDHYHLVSSDKYFDIWACAPTRRETPSRTQ